MAKTCMVDVDSRADIESVRDTHPFTITMYHSKNCPHCKKMLPEIESECKSLQEVSPEQLIAVINCPIDKDFCREEAIGYGAKGIPFTVGKPKGQEPVFKIEGAVIDEMKGHFNTLKKMVLESSGRAQQTPQPAKIHESDNYGDSGGGNIQDNAILNTMVPPRNNRKMGVGFGQPRIKEPVHLCTPGLDCTHNEYESKVIKFISSSKPEKREKNAPIF